LKIAPDGEATEDMRPCNWGSLALTLG